MDLQAVIAPVVFWTFAFLSVGLFAAVLLLPRLEQLDQLAGEADQLSAKVDRMRHANRELALQVEALQRDPFYIGQVARRDLGFRSPGEQRVAVGRLYQSRPALQPLEPETPAWLQRVRDRLAHDEGVRRAALVTAGVLLMCAFVFFNRSSPSRVPAPEPAIPADPGDLDDLPIVDGVPMDHDVLPVIDVPVRRRAS